MTSPSRRRQLRLLCVSVSALSLASAFVAGLALVACGSSGAAPTGAGDASGDAANGPEGGPVSDAGAPDAAVDGAITWLLDGGSVTRVALGAGGGQLVFTYAPTGSAAVVGECLALPGCSFKPLGAASASSSIAGDGVDGYWGWISNGSATGEVSQGDGGGYDGGPGCAVWSAAAGPDVPADMAYASDTLYWVDTRLGVFHIAAPVASCGPGSATNDSVTPGQAIALTGSGVFWIGALNNGNGTTTYYLPFTGSACDGGTCDTVHASPLVDIASNDQDAVFVLDKVGGVYAVGVSAGTLSFGGNALATVDAGTPRALAADGRYVYVAADNGIFYVPVGGGAPTALTGGGATDIAIDQHYIYFANPTGLWRIGKP